MAVPKVSRRPFSKAGEKNYGYGYENESSANRQSLSVRLKLQNRKKEDETPDDTQKNQQVRNTSLRKKKELTEEEKLARMTPKQVAAYNAQKRKKAEALAKKNKEKNSVMDSDIAQKISEKMSQHFRRVQAKVDAEERENVYGFKRALLQSPTCIEMLNRYSIKKANVETFDNLYNDMKRRKATGLQSQMTIQGVGSPGIRTTNGSPTK